ncbi:MAG: RsmG family class I SAM-dependent methyltransferase [Solidesulfovibrio sp.]|uniref:16S rRNA (guanine(527)-N(7))-methyltransferase RsmG n=1 Tax=Solidesulfovibrio sp. TaxID=2910990 RepID=UPI002B1F8A2C|nr:RsmG family class I SAM-dependent methyltransferase [Solidesulfovibrio sp.]MEA4857360.1 RsmG family class I SAM-dependent methyltransferase [Solidesulfovibrio sp.]
MRNKAVAGSFPPPDAPAVTREAAALGRRLTREQATLLAGYLQLVERFRGKVNLVGPADWPTVLATLVADSWHLADFLAGPAVSRLLPPAGAPVACLDFGAGAGLPGIPLRAFWNRGPYYLLEARRKRCVFLTEAVARLGLAGLAVAEGDVARIVPAVLAGRGEGFVLCVSRAFAPWREFLAVCRALVPPPMAVVTMTGEACRDDAPGFGLAAAAAYPVGGRTRHLSLYSPAVPSM